MSSNDSVTLDDAIYASQAVVLQTVFAMPALALYTLVLSVIIRFYKSWKSPFFNILISLGVADLYYQCSIMFYCIPCIVMQTHIYGDTADQVFGFLDTLIWFSQISHLLYVAINRLVFASGREIAKLDRWFSHSKTCLSLALIWLFSFCISLLMILGSCQKPFNYEGYYFGFYCTNTDMGSAVQMVNEVISNLFPALSFFIYIAVWQFIRQRHKKVAGAIQSSAADRRTLDEVRMSVQFTLICATNIFVGISFWVVPRFLTSKSGSILLGIFAIWNAGINPYLYVAMNSGIKDKTQEFLFGKKTERAGSIKPTTAAT